MHLQQRYAQYPASCPDREKAGLLKRHIDRLPGRWRQTGWNRANLLDFRGVAPTIERNIHCLMSEGRRMEKTSYLLKRFNQTVMMEHPDSHIIECYGYLASERLLLVKILDNALYAYENVSPVIFRQMQLAASKGKFFLREIRDYYNYRRMGPNEYKIGPSQNVTEPVANTISPVWPEFQTQVPDCWL